MQGCSAVTSVSSEFHSLSCYSWWQGFVLEKVPCNFNVWSCIHFCINIVLGTGKTMATVIPNTQETVSGPILCFGSVTFLLLLYFGTGVTAGQTMSNARFWLSWFNTRHRKTYSSCMCSKTWTCCAVIGNAVCTVTFYGNYWQTCCLCCIYFSTFSIWDFTSETMIRVFCTESRH